MPVGRVTDQDPASNGVWQSCEYREQASYDERKIFGSDQDPFIVKCLDPDLVFRSVRSGSGESLNTRVRIPNPHLRSDSVNFSPDPWN